MYTSLGMTGLIIVTPMAGVGIGTIGAILNGSTSTAQFYWSVVIIFVDEDCFSIHKPKIDDILLQVRQGRRR
jgi:ammonia channel protein AmtB